MSDVQNTKDQRARDAATFRNLSGVEAQHLIKTNRAEYERLRSAAGVIPGYRQPGLRLTGRREEQAVHSDEDLQLMIQYPKSECIRYFKKTDGSMDNLGRMRLSDPAKFEAIRNAAILHNVIVGEIRHTPVTPPAARLDDKRIEAGLLGEVAGIPATERITQGQYLDLLAAKAAADKAKS
jgi:hypothetical protein